jgi:hypothetical protein
MFNSKTEQQIIQEIHNEFDTAEDRLLEQADSLLRELDIPTETAIEIKADKLAMLGFVNSETVVKAKSLKDVRRSQEAKIVKTRAQAELIRYYKQTYPFQKFLTESELERICDKYKLIFAPVSNYIKDVPEKNINEILKCTPLNKNDEEPTRYFVKVTRFWNDTEKEIMELLKDEFEYTGRISGDEPTDDGLKDILKLKGYNNPLPLYIFNKAQLKTVRKDGLFIAAPPSHFNLTGLTKQNKFGFLNITITEIKDPIVFRYCKGGVQVLSKWGLESSDEALLNEINN